MEWFFERTRALRLTVLNATHYFAIQNLNHLAVPFEKHPSSRPRISPAALWVIFCAFCNFIGWTLSALHQLNAVGYAVAFGFGLLAFALWKRNSRAVLFRARDVCKLRRRFSRAVPLGVLC